MNKIFLVPFLLLSGCSWLFSMAPDRLKGPNGETFKASLPVEIDFDDNFPQEDRSSVVNSINYWNQISGQKLFIMGHSKGESVLLSESQMDVQDAHREGRHFEIAATFNGPSIQTQHGNESVLAQITFFKRWATLPNAEQENVVRHELGHILALGHSDDMGCLMYRDSLPSDNPRGLCAGELQMIQNIYAKN